MESTDRRLRAIFHSVFDIPERADVTVCNRLNTPTWDSMAHVTLIVALEEEFGIAMDVADSLAITSFESARQYLMSSLNA